MLPESRKEQGLFMIRPVRENISIVDVQAIARLGVVDRRTEARRTSALATDLDVRAASQEAMVTTLSGGNQQKVLFAKWLFRRPKLLIADEPTRGVDVGAKRQIYELLIRLARRRDGDTADLLGDRGGARPLASRPRDARRAGRASSRATRRPTRQ